MLICGNWKMNLNRKEAASLIKETAALVGNATCEVGFCVPFTDLEAAQNSAKNTNIIIGAQNCHWAEKGAYTGEISAKMLSELDVPMCIVGHSERRQYFGETDETANLRAKALIDEGIRCIFCLGETLEEREAGKTFEVIDRQLKLGLKDLEQGYNLVIAYEPVWAIGTGKTATAQEAQEVCEHIRSLLKNKKTLILYGGSMNAKNADELLSMKDIDGGLIGGASLKPEDFSKIVEAATKRG